MKPKATRLNLAERLTAQLRARLGNQDLQPGDKLPTEQALGQEYGVSRTVVREAVASLRADGLVVARQGSGVYVARRPDRPFGLSLFTIDPARISSIIEVLELRAAVESEAAALAAERHSPAELAKIEERHRAISAAMAAGQWAEDQDFEFHLAIAEATHNRHFVEFFSFLGRRTIPRRQLQSEGPSADQTRVYFERIQIEHRDIIDGIAARDEALAHEKMRAHLKGSQARYQKLANQAA